MSAGISASSCCSSFFSFFFYSKYEHIHKEEVDDTPRDIISSKDAIIKDIDAISGEIVKNINDYVKKGETIKVSP